MAGALVGSGGVGAAGFADGGRRPTAPVFVERSPPAEAPAQVWWYWCNESRAYYPYVKECPAGWQRVAPQTVVPRTGHDETTLP